MSTNRELLELDMWRGLAVIFMVANHGGYALVGGWGDQNTLERVIVFIGSFAPVLFFFITGFGYGVSHFRKGGASRAFDLSTWYKAAVLILMDLLIRGADWTHLGWDFLGFIAMSMVLLSLLRQSRAPLAIATVLAVLLVLLRFGAGPLVETAVSAQEGGIVHGVLGLRAFDGVSYWFTPWLIYPLLGFVAGHFFSRYRDAFLQRQWVLVLMLGVSATFFLLLSGVLAWSGMVFFRWGTVSAAYFILSFGVLLVTALLCWLCAVTLPASGFARCLSLRGVSSLAVVPIHYALIYYLSQVVPPPLTTSVFLLMLIALISGSYLLAGYINSATRNIINLNLNLGVVLTFFGTVVMLTLLADWLPLAGTAKMTYIYTLELLLCLLLPLRLRVTGRAADVALSNPSGAGGR